MIKRFVLIAKENDVNLDHKDDWGIFWKFYESACSLHTGARLLPINVVQALINKYRQSDNHAEEELTMNKEEARGIYEMASAICLSREGMKKLCIEKRVPEPWIAEFIEKEENRRL